MSWIDQLQEAGFEDKPEGWDKGSIKKYTKTFTKKMKGGAKDEGFFDKCVKKMQGKMENPEGFCASLKDEAYGSTYWRGKDKKPSAVKQAVAKHQNVKEDAKVIPIPKKMQANRQAMKKNNDEIKKKFKNFGKEPSARVTRFKKRQELKKNLKASGVPLESVSTSDLEARAASLKKKVNKLQKKQKIDYDAVNKLATDLQFAKKQVDAAKLTINNTIKRNANRVASQKQRYKIKQKRAAIGMVSGLIVTLAGLLTVHIKNRKQRQENIQLTENFLQSLYTDNRGQAKEWRGANIPTGDDSDRPNLIRQCMTMEGTRQKINCLRKLRDQAAMNPFYQHRLDRFVDAITDTYEPTNQQGTIPGNEFKETAVGEDFDGEVPNSSPPARERVSESSAKCVKADQTYQAAKANLDEIKQKVIECRRAYRKVNCGEILSRQRVATANLIKLFNKRQKHC